MVSSAAAQQPLPLLPGQFGACRSPAMAARVNARSAIAMEHCAVAKCLRCRRSRRRWEAGGERPPIRCSLPGPCVPPTPAEGGVYYSDQQFVSAGAGDEAQLPNRAAALAKFGEFIRTFQVWPRLQPCSLCSRPTARRPVQLPHAGSCHTCVVLQLAGAGARA